MTKKLYPEESVQAIADAIRSKNGSSETYKIGQMAEAINNIPTGGGMSAEVKQINFIDYDGTIVDSYTSAEWSSVSALPSNPTHDGLLAQGWNWTKAQIDAQLTAMPDAPVWIGQMYITASGDTEIDISFDNSIRLSPYLRIAVNGEITIDWGDGSMPSVVAGTSLKTPQNTQHVYSHHGMYTIKIHVVSGAFAFYGDSNATLLNRNSNSININRPYSIAVKAIRIGANASIGSYSFNYCTCLNSITIPDYITSIGDHAFYYCQKLASITIPSGITNITTYMLSNLNFLTSISIPIGVTNIEERGFENFQSLESITMPINLTNIGKFSLSGDRALASITIPSSVTDIVNNAFGSCYGMEEYHFKRAEPPTVGTNIFYNNQQDFVIYVPSASLSAYQSASGWSSYASQMVGE